MENLNGNFLAVLNSAWDHHHTYMLMISDVLMYLDRVYLETHGMDNIYTLGLKLFRDLVIFYFIIRLAKLFYKNISILIHI